MVLVSPWRPASRGAQPRGGRPPSGSGSRRTAGSRRGAAFALESPVVDATLLAVDEVNQAGGVLGRPLEAVVRDGRSDPQIFAQQAELLLQNEGVPTVFGCWTSASRKTVAPIFERFERLLVYPVQYEGLEESPWVFYLGAAPNQQLIPALQWAYAFGNKRKFFLVGSDYVFPRTANAIARDTLSGLGAQVVGEEYLPLGSYQVEAIVERIRDAVPDVILNTINGDSNVPFFKALRGAGLTTDKVTTISLSIGEEELRFLDVAHMVGDFAAWNYFQSIESPENRDFVARFRQRYGPRRLLTDPMEAAYLGVKLWAAAVNQAGSLDPVAIREALRLQSTQAPEGAVRIDAATHHAYKTPRIGRITPDGQFEIIWTAAKPEPPLPFPPSRSKRDWEIFLENLYLGWNENWSAPQR
jgi:urea transport system substrate-binding protein